MSRAVSSRTPWQPQTAQERDAILRELREVVASSYFCNSKRYPALLQYIVENTLEGKTDLLKERTLGIEVFDRPTTYDTNVETVVRFTAGEVRKRLQLYYHERGHSSRVRISLPVGSYIPEFLHDHNELGDTVGEYGGPAADQVPDRHVPAYTVGAVHELPPVLAEAGIRAFPPPVDEQTKPKSSPAQTQNFAKIFLWLSVGGLVVIAFLAGLSWKPRAVYTQTPLDDFWMPVLHEQRTVVICSGGVVFKQNRFSGVITAGKDIEYPFVSMQIASAIAQVSSLLARSGATTQLLSAPSTPLTDLREYPVVLLGAYNNQWAMRLLQSQRFQFTAEPVESIVDQTQPQAHWTRDKSLPYSSTDDYAVVARFRDATTGSWVVVLAGLGRNGTEAAAQFAANPRYMQMLRNDVGRDFSNLNIEVLLKVNVIDGKTGAPAVLAVSAR